MFDVTRFLETLRQLGCSLGEPFTYFSETDSTNTQAKLAVKAGAPHGATFLADRQTSGRGRQGRTWVAERDEALLFSVVLKPKLSAQDLSATTLVVGLGVREALAQHVSLPLQIKWPNDVLVAAQNGGTKQKLAGILVESDLVVGASPSLVAGIGINTAVSAFPDELAASAISLSALCRGATPITREALLVELLSTIERWLFLFSRDGFSAIVPALNEHDALRGLRLRVTTSDGSSALGFGSGIDNKGCLLLETDAGVQSISAGTVEFEPA